MENIKLKATIKNCIFKKKADFVSHLATYLVTKEDLESHLAT